MSLISYMLVNLSALQIRRFDEALKDLIDFMYLLSLRMRVIVESSSLVLGYSKVSIFLESSSIP